MPLVTKHPKTLTEPQRSHLSSVIRTHNISAVCKAMGLSRELLAKLAAGIPVRAGSVALAQTALPRLDAAMTSAAPAPRAA